METLAATKTQSWLSWFLRGLLLIGLVFLLARLFELQVIKGNYFRLLSEGNRIRRVPIAPPRGRIFARGGELLVGNKEVKKVIRFDSQKGFEKLNQSEANSGDETISEWERTYPLADSFAHVSGYVGEANEAETGKIDPLCPDQGPRKLGSLVGRAGLEEAYDCQLSGTYGEELVEVDTKGKKIRTLGKKKPVAGEDRKTFIDFGLQEKVSQIMEGKKGAIIVTDAGGEILALYSSPSFDPNKFINQDDQNYISRTLKDTSLPLFNRAIGGQFHPGSVFKPVVAIAALSEGKIDKNYTFEDPGVIKVGTFTYYNWYFTQAGRTEGRIGVTWALARSTDTFFYTLGEFVGAQKLASYADNFGLDKKTGIDIPGEIEGLVPTPEWKLRVKGEPWFLGNTYHMAIGQGDMGLTPIGVNQMVAAIASGKLCGPRVIEEPECRDLKINKEYLDIVREGMVGACTSGGTGFTFFDWNSGSTTLTTDRSGPVACKTGTAETNEDGKTHAWFTAFAPARSPEIVATVLVERGGEGSVVAGPIARQIFDYWFAKHHD